MGSGEVFDPIFVNNLVIRIAELALQAKEKGAEELYQELVYGIKMIQHPVLELDKSSRTQFDPHRKPRQDCWWQP